jgi:hypothetical protein
VIAASADDIAITIAVSTIVKPVRARMILPPVRAG